MPPTTRVYSGITVDGEAVGSFLADIEASIRHRQMHPPKPTRCFATAEEIARKRGPRDKPSRKSPKKPGKGRRL